MKGDEDDQANDNSSNSPGNDTCAGDQIRVRRHPRRDQPGGVAGEGKDKAIREVYEPET